MVVMWLHILLGPYWCVYVALFGSRLLPNSATYCTHTNKDPIIYAATSPHNIYFIYNGIYVRATCFGAVTPSSGSALLVLAKVTVVKIAN